MFKKKNDIIKIANGVLPHERQIRWQETELAAHVFFGLNTFVRMQEGTGKTEANAFYPTDIDIPSWVNTFKDAGMKGVLITAKHRDGFCLWRSKTTSYTVANSPYRDGEGDIVRELSDECRKENMKFGFSFSLCDRNTDKKGEDLEKLILGQLEELLTSYGEIYEVKLDTEGEKADIDMEKIYDLVRLLQPNAVISNGPDARHVGNKRTVCRPEEWNVIKPVSRWQESVKIDESKDDTFRTPDGVGKMELDLGSRKALKKANNLCWQPYFADISIRDSWFYDKEEDLRTMLLQKLKDIYFSVTGANGVLEVGVPIDQRGRIHEEETITLQSFGVDMEMLKKNPLLKKSKLTSNCGGESVENLKKDDDTYFFSGETDGKIELTVDFGEDKIIKLIELGENIATGQQIEKFSVYTLEGKKFKKAETHSVIGYKKLILPKKPMLTSAVKIVIEETRGFATLKTLEIYSA